MLGDPLNWAKMSDQIRFLGGWVKKKENLTQLNRRRRLSEGDLSIQAAGLQKRRGQ